MELEEEKRAYTGADVDMTQAAHVTHGHLVEDLAAFTAFDSTIDAAFADDYLDAIEAAETVVADSAVIDQQSGLTTAVNVQMDKARTKYKQMKYYLQQAYPTDMDVQNEFGVNDYEKARRKTTQMMQFLDEMHKAAIKYKPRLLLKGCSEAAITEITTIRTDLHTANLAQEMFKSGRPKLTRERIIILNTPYYMMARINAAAQLVYANDYAKQQQFIYNPTPETTEEDSDIFTGTVNPSATKTITTINEDATLVLSNTGTDKLVFYLSSTEDAIGEEVIVLAGETVTTTTADMSPDGDGTYLVVKNPNTTTIGSYSVEIQV